MAICPVHGHYDGTCKKCQPTDPGPAKMKLIEAPELPVIPQEDKYILRSFENEALNAQIDGQNANARQQAAMQSMNRHAGVVFEKLGIDPKEWILDMKQMVLIKREIPKLEK